MGGRTLWHERKEKGKAMNYALLWGIAVEERWGRRVQTEGKRGVGENRDAELRAGDRRGR